MFQLLNTTFLRKCSVNIPGCLLFVLFVGFFWSISFFDHTHLYEGNIVVHSHPFKLGMDDKPMHNLCDSGYLLVYQLNNFISDILFPFLAFTIILVHTGMIIFKSINESASGLNHSPYFLRGPPNQ